MTTKEKSVNIARRLIHIFLSTVSSFDKSIRPHIQRKEPIWVSMFNFPSLLNLPDQIEKFGPVQNRWEGGSRGEGFLRNVKPVIQSRQKNWQFNLMKNLLREKCLLHLKKSVDTMEDDNESVSSSDNEQEHDPQSFVSYPSVVDISMHLNQGDPISCLLCDNTAKVVFVFFLSSRKKKVLKLQHESTNSEYINGLWYASFGFINDPNINDDMDLGDIVCTEYGILLPKRLPDGSTEQKYAIVTSSWLTMNENGELVQPHVLLNNKYPRRRVTD